MILLIDNYDSFAYNLYQLIGRENADIKVVRNDEISTDDIEKLNPELIVLSPGPGKPSDAGICIDTIKKFAGKIPIFGVCLGHQAICEAFGATIGYAKKMMHGKTSMIQIDNNTKLFKNMEQTIKVGRYHSLAADESTMPAQLKITAKTDDGEIMAVEHSKYKVYGVQFHPESILTPEGSKIIKNILS